MSKNIKGITVEIGAETSGLDKALSGVNKETRNVQKELREVDKLLKFNPGNTELVAQKQKLLGDAVDTTKEKLDKLKEAESQVQEQFEKGEISEEQYRAFQREIVATEGKLAHYEGQLKAVSDTKKTFKERTEEIGKSLQDVGGKMTALGGKFTKGITAPAIAAGGAIVALAKKSGDFADRTLDLADITGLATDSIQEWSHVAVVAGVDTESMTGAMEGLIKRIPQLESEGGKATEGLNKLGLEYGKLKELSPDEQFDSIIYALAEMEDPLERNAIGSQLFGGAWKDIAPVLGNGTEAIKGMRDEAHELGNVLSEDSLNDANNFRIEMDKMKESLEKAAYQIGADLAPMLRDTLVPIIQDQVVPGIQRMVEKVQDAITWYSELSPEIQKLIKTIALIVIGIGPFLVIVGKMITTVGIITGAMGKLGPVIAGISAPIAIAIGAVVAMVAIGVALYKNWDTIKTKAGQLGSYISTKFQQIGGFISKPVDAAKTKVSNAVNAIKGFFTNMKLKIPKFQMPKMPKFSITGKFSWKERTIPKIGVTWNKEGAIFTKPYIFGNQGVGEAGPEAVLPISKLSQIMADTLNKMNQGGSSQKSNNTNNIVNHTGTIQVKGVNDKNELQGVVDIVMDELRREVRSS